MGSKRNTNIAKFRTAIMKLPLLFLLGLSANEAFADKPAQLKQCKRICKDNEPNTALICHPALTPKSTFKACFKGSTIAFTHACIPTCMGDTKEDAGNSHQACKNYWKKARPNNELSFCRFGYDRTYEKVIRDISLVVQNGQAGRTLLDSKEENSVQDLTTLALGTDDSWKKGDILLGDKEDEIPSSIQDNAVEDEKDEATLGFFSFDQEFKDKEFLEAAEEGGFVSEKDEIVMESVDAATFASDKESESKEYAVKHIVTEAFIEIEAMQNHKDIIEIEDAGLDMEKHDLGKIPETNPHILLSEEDVIDNAFVVEGANFEFELSH